MDDLPDPARLAAIDQKLAEMDDRLELHARAIMRGDVAFAIIALALVIYYLASPAEIPRWQVVAAWAAVTLLAAGGFVQGLMLRSYRSEIRELRVRPSR
jgi:hypothetical protein